MSFASKIKTLEIKGAFGRRAIAVFGGKGTIKDTGEFLSDVAKIDRENGTVTQVFNAMGVAGTEHLIQATRLALTAHATNKNFASSLGVELMCWVAAERQIGRAFEKMGLQEGNMNMAFVVVGTSRIGVKASVAKILQKLPVERDDTVIEVSPSKVPSIKRIFGITPMELKVVPLKKLVVERVALLALSK